MVLKILRGLAWVIGVLLLLFLLMQIVPYGRTHGNPKITAEPHWNTPRTRELAKRACFDCHSNETRWPWYANVAPFSWVVQHDVVVAREVVNFSEWSDSDWPTLYPTADSASKSLRLKTMPPFKYRMAHPEADLTPEETDALAKGLDESLVPPVKDE